MITEKEMFADAQVGDRVWCISKGWGVISYIDRYTIKVKFKDDELGYFDLDGREYSTDVNPILFWDEIKFEIPEKPFDLENELKKLKVQEFKTAERNYFLTWDNAGKSIYYDIVGNNEQPDIKYFTEQSINNFMENVKDKKITKEQFFEAYKKVFGGKIIC